MIRRRFASWLNDRPELIAVLFVFLVVIAVVAIAFALPVPREIRGRAHGAHVGSKDDPMQQDRALTLLRDARFILSRPDRWSRGAGLARDENGSACEFDSQAAQAFTLRGALERSLFERGYASALLDGAPARTLVNEAKAILLPSIPWRGLDREIDRLAAGATHDGLLRWLDAAIERRARDGVNVSSVRAAG